MRANYTIAGVTLDSVNIIFHSKLTYKPLILNFVSKAAKTMSFLLRNCKHFINKNFKSFLSLTTLTIFFHFRGT